MFENFYNKSNYIEGLGSCIKHILRMKMLLEQRTHTLSLPQIQTKSHTHTHESTRSLDEKIRKKSIEFNELGNYSRLSTNEQRN